MVFKKLKEKINKKKEEELKEAEEQQKEKTEVIETKTDGKPEEPKAPEISFGMESAQNYNLGAAILEEIKGLRKDIRELR